MGTKTAAALVGLTVIISTVLSQVSATSMRMELSDVATASDEFVIIIMRGTAEAWKSSEFEFSDTVNDRNANGENVFFSTLPRRVSRFILWIRIKSLTMQRQWLIAIRESIRSLSSMHSQKSFGEEHSLKSR